MKMSDVINDDRTSAQKNSAKLSREGGGGGSQCPQGTLIQVAATRRNVMDVLLLLLLHLSSTCRLEP